MSTLRLLALLVTFGLAGFHMPETLLWSDDFAYGSKPALDAAYPYTFDNSLTGMSFNIVLVNPGLTGYPTGITSKGVDLDYGGLFDVNHWLIAPVSRCFHVRGVWKIDAVDTINTAVGPMSLGWADAASFFGYYWSLGIRIDDPTALQLNVSGGTYPAPVYDSGYIPGILTPNANNEIDVSGLLSTLTQTSPGVYAPNSDGSVVVTVNGVEVISWSGVVWNWKDDVATLQWNFLNVRPAGTMSGLRLWDCGAATPPAVEDHADVCCSTGGGDTIPTGGGTGHGAPPTLTATIGTQIACVGGGLVPTQADLVPSELWWGL